MGTLKGATQESINQKKKREKEEEYANEVEREREAGREENCGEVATVRAITVKAPTIYNVLTPPI